MIRVLIVDDSNVVAMLLKAVLSREPDIDVLGRAENGQQALEMVQRLKPDLVTMDVQMPHMNGFEATRAIMADCPTPVILVSSSVNAEEVHNTFQAIDEGAVAVVEQPQLGGGGNSRYDPLKEFLRMVRLMSTANTRPQTDTSPAAETLPTQPPALEAIALASAEGGLHALVPILASLDSAPPCPIIVNQQLAPGFLEGLITWLGPKIKHPLKLAEAGERLQPGTVYITPDGHDMTLTRDGDALVCTLMPFDSEQRLSPSADILFHGLAQVCAEKAIAVVLSGRDHGISGLKAMKDAGALVLGQDERFALIKDGLSQARQADAISYALTPEAIARVLAGR